MTNVNLIFCFLKEKQLQLGIGFESPIEFLQSAVLFIIGFNHCQINLPKPLIYG